MSGFFEEVKRRKVYRVAIAYVVASWALAQGLAQVLPVFDISNSVIRVVIALMLIGFPVALVLAWIFDITPTGIKTTPDMTPSVSHRRRNVIMLVATGVIISAAAGFFLLPRASARKIDKSIAVLPFENLSNDQENAFFADGIQDDILTNLSKIGDLKVISRTSVMQYRGKGNNVREIGKALGVSAILGGQRAALGKSDSRQRAVDRCDHRRTHLGERLRSRADRRLHDPKRSRAKNRGRTASQAFADGKSADDAKADRKW